MELFTLIVINIITAVALYILFSVRFSLAVDKIVERTRKNAVLKDLRENVEATVEYINTSLDLMDQKNRSFYQLVRRSEELVAKLEARGPVVPSGDDESADIGPDMAGVLTEQELNILQAPLSEQETLPPISGKKPKAPREASSPLSKAADVEPESRPEKTSGPGSTLDRVLDAMGDDRAEISGGAGSAEEARQGAQMSADVARRFQPAKRPGGSGHEGFYPHKSGFTMEDVGLAQSQTPAPREPGWVSVLEGAGRTVRRIFGMSEMDQAPPGGDPGPGGPQRRSDSGIDREWRSPPRETPEENPFEALLNEKRERLADEREEYVPPSEDSVPLAATELQRERTADVSAPEEPSEIELMRQEVRAATPAGRREIILRLSERGYASQEIASLTGIGKAEVDLVASLPVTPVRPRRTRRK